jgi:hypothetical protein
MSEELALERSGQGTMLSVRLYLQNRQVSISPTPSGRRSALYNR